MVAGVRADGQPARSSQVMPGGGPPTPGSASQPAAALGGLLGRLGAIPTIAADQSPRWPLQPGATAAAAPPKAVRKSSFGGGDRPKLVLRRPSAPVPAAAATGASPHVLNTAEAGSTPKRPRVATLDISSSDSDGGQDEGRGHGQAGPAKRARAGSSAAARAAAAEAATAVVEAERAKAAEANRNKATIDLTKALLEAPPKASFRRPGAGGKLASRRGGKGAAGPGWLGSSGGRVAGGLAQTPRSSSDVKPLSTTERFVRGLLSWDLRVRARAGCLASAGSRAGLTSHRSQLSCSYWLPAAAAAHSSPLTAYMARVQAALDPAAAGRRKSGGGGEDEGLSGLPERFASFGEYFAAWAPLHLAELQAETAAAVVKDGPAGRPFRWQNHRRPLPGRCLHVNRCLNHGPPTARLTRRPFRVTLRQAEPQPAAGWEAGLLELAAQRRDRLQGGGGGGCFSCGKPGHQARQCPNKAAGGGKGGKGGCGGGGFQELLREQTLGAGSHRPQRFCTGADRSTVLCRAVLLAGSVETLEEVTGHQGLLEDQPGAEEEAEEEEEVEEKARGLGQGKGRGGGGRGPPPLPPQAEQHRLDSAGRGDQRGNGGNGRAHGRGGAHDCPPLHPQTVHPTHSHRPD